MGNSVNAFIVVMEMTHLMWQAVNFMTCVNA